MTVSPTDPAPRQLHASLCARLAGLGDPPKLSRIAGGEQVQPFHFALLFRFAVIFEGIASRTTTRSDAVTRVVERIATRMPSRRVWTLPVLALLHCAAAAHGGGPICAAVGRTPTARRRN